MSDEEDFQTATVEKNDENLATALNLDELVIKIGDILHDSRYEVIRKLGSGWYSRVWLCKDLRENERFVALKVLKEESDTDDCMEVDVLKYIKDVYPSNGKIVTILDDFNIPGVQIKSHACMVFEVFGCSLDDMMARNNYKAIPLANVKSIVKQALEGLDFLHTKCEIVHGDFKLKNILLVEEEGDSDPAQQVCDFKIIIADLGYAYTIKEELGFATPVDYGVEVLLFDSEHGPAHDIWSTALFTFELATGDMLFYPQSGEGHSTDEDHLAQMRQLLGDIPHSMATTGNTSKQFFNENGELNYKGDYQPSTILEVLTTNYKWEADEAKDFCEFLLPMLDYDISKRPSAAQLLQHPWLQQ